MNGPATKHKKQRLEIRMYLNIRQGLGLRAHDRDKTNQGKLTTSGVGYDTLIVTELSANPAHIATIN